MKVRCFISINVPERVRSSMVDYRQRLESTGANVGWVKPAGLHFTLKFLGDVDEALLPAISEAAGRAVSGSLCFELSIDDRGAFPNWRRPRVIWLGCSAVPGELELLHDAIEEELARINFPRESRPFQPHLTIGRVRSERRLAELREKIENTPPPAQRFLVQSVYLMRSELKPSGAEYYSIAEFGLRIAE